MTIHLFKKWQQSAQCKIFFKFSIKTSMIEADKHGREQRIIRIYKTFCTLFISKKIFSLGRADRMEAVKYFYI